MILKDYNVYNLFYRKEGAALVEIKDHHGDYDGYYQRHQVGDVCCDLPHLDLLLIGDKKFDIRTFSKANYLVDGENRTVEFVDVQGKVVDQFSYQVFWLDEADMLEVAFELPEDDERDLLKFITNKINALNEFEV